MSVLTEDIALCCVVKISRSPTKVNNTEKSKGHVNWKEDKVRNFLVVVADGQEGVQPGRGEMKSTVFAVADIRNTLQWV